MTTMSARIDPADHLARPWRVHALAPDFELLDVWRFDVRGRADQFPQFLRIMADMERTLSQTNAFTRALFRLRFAMGKVFGWDRERAPLPIPGCREHSIVARMPGGHDVVEPRSDASFHPVYEDDREALSEVANSTVHGLMHLGWVALDDGTFAPQMSVYAKARGVFGRIYMSLIGPFRHLVVYPSLLGAVQRRWSAEATADQRSRRALGREILRDG